MPIPSGPCTWTPCRRAFDLDDPSDTATLLRNAGVAAAPTPSAAAGVTPAGASTVGTLTAHVTPSCSGTGVDGKRVQVLYVRETTTPSRFTSVLPALRNEVANVDDVVAVSAEQTGGLRRVRWVHDADCAPVIEEVVLPAGSLGAEWRTTVSAMSAAGYKANDRKYLMFADAQALCGIGSVYADSSSSATNHNNVYGGYARIDTPCWSTSHSLAAHELTHNLGGVQGSAPHATVKGHCYDESDLMCYDDGSGVAMKQVCAGAQEDLLDCNKDDYFSTAPPANSYLATNWNVASSGFLDRTLTEPPASAPPVVTVTASSDAAQTGDRVTFTASASTASTWQWSGATGCTLTPESPGTATVLCPATVTGTVTVRATATDSSTRQSGTGSASVSMTQAAAPTPVLTAPSSATAGTSFPVDVSVSGKAPFGYAWTVEGCTVAAPSAASTTVTCPADAPAQRLPVTVRVSQADAQSTSRTSYVDLAASASTPPTPEPAASSWTAPALTRGVLTAGLRSAGAPMARTPVVLQARWSGESTYVDLATVSTDDAGVASARPDYPRAGSFRFAFAGGASASAAVSADTFVKVATAVSAGSPRRKVVGATLATSTGERVGGASVVLRKRVSGTSRWVYLTSARTGTTGQVAVAVRPRRLTYYRWTYAGSSSFGGSTSGQVAVRR